MSNTYNAASDKLLTKTEVAARLRVSESTVNRMLGKSLTNVNIIGKQVLISEAELNNLIQAKSKPEKQSKQLSFLESLKKCSEATNNEAVFPITARELSKLHGISMYKVYKHLKGYPFYLEDGRQRIYFKIFAEAHMISTGLQLKFDIKKYLKIISNAKCSSSL